VQNANAKLSTENKHLKEYVDEYIGEDKESYLHQQSMQIAKLEKALEAKKSTAKSRFRIIIAFKVGVTPIVVGTRLWRTSDRSLLGWQAKVEQGMRSTSNSRHFRHVLN